MTKLFFFLTELLKLDQRRDQVADWKYDLCPRVGQTQEHIDTYYVQFNCFCETGFSAVLFLLCGRLHCLIQLLIKSADKKIIESVKNNRVCQLIKMSQNLIFRLAEGSAPKSYFDD